MEKKDRGTYICKAETGSTTALAQLMAYSRLRFKVHPSQEVTPAKFGLTVRLPCVAEGDLKPTITWTKNGNTSLPVDPSISLIGTLALQNIEKSHEGYYTCRGTNALTTVEAKVKINSPVAASCFVIKKIRQQCKRKLRH